MTEGDTGNIELRSMMSVEWRINNFFGLPEKIDYEVHSPTFSFMNASWFIKVYPYGRTLRNSFGWMGVYLIKMCPLSSEHNVSYRVGVREESGRDYFSWKFEHKFEINERGWGRDEFLKRCDLLNSKSRIAPHGDLTLFCTFNFSPCETSEVALQTIHTEVSGFEKLSRDLQNFFLDGEDYDIVLNVKDEEFNAHKAILRARSPVFRAMFAHNMQESIISAVHITDCNPLAFRDFLHYLYSGQLERFSSSTVSYLYIIADKYDVSDLKVECVQFMLDNLSVDTFFDVITVAFQHSEAKLLESTTKFFMNKASEIIETENWLSFLKENPVKANDLYKKALESKHSK